MPKFLILDRGAFDLAIQGTSEGKSPKDAVEKAGPDVPMPERVVLIEEGAFTNLQVVSQDEADDVELIIRAAPKPPNPRDEPQLGPEGSRVQREQAGG